MFAQRMLVSSRTSLACRTAACDFRMPSLVTIKKKSQDVILVMMVWPEDLWVVQFWFLTPCSARMGKINSVSARPNTRECLPSATLLLCLTFPFIQTYKHVQSPSPTPHCPLHSPPSLVACRQPVILCSGPSACPHPAQFCLFSPPALSDMRQSSDTKAGTISAVHFVCCLPSHS